MPDLFRYSLNFEPLLLEGMTANLFGSDLPAEGLPVVCRAVGALPQYQKDFGALTAATWDTDNEDTNLEMGQMELAQYRMRIQDDIKARLKNPAAVQQWRTAKTNFELPQFPTGDESIFLKNFLWMASEFFVWEDTTPRFDLYSSVTLTTARILFSGWRFKVAKLQAGQKGKIDLWLNSWPPASSK